MLKIKVYVIHAAFLDYRKPMVESLISKLNKHSKFSKVDVEYIVDQDPDKMNVEQAQSKISLGKNGKSEFFDQFVRNIHIKQVSNAVKHASAIQKAASEGTKYDYYLVIEDDVIYGEDVAKRLDDLLDLYNVDKPDILFVGLPSIVPISQESMQIKPTKDMFRVLPCCDSYILTASSAAKLASVFLPIRFVTNVHLSYLTEVEGITSSMAIPNVFLDGSKFGVYLSTLESNNRLFLNPDYNKLQVLVKKDSYTKEDHESIKAILSNIRFKNHPDVMYLSGLYDLKKGNYEKAKETLESVYNVFTQNNCLINGESEFLQTYMSVFKHFQSDLISASS